MDKDKVQAVLDWPPPKNLKQLRGFLDLTRYYRRFIKSYSIISLPLINLLKIDTFHWDYNVGSAFNLLKQVVIIAPVLALPYFTQPFVLEIEAYSTGVGVVLS